MATVRLEGVTKAFRGTPVLEAVDLEIADGELLVFVGASGCGKSTLLRLIAGLEQPSSGEIWIGGKRVTQRPPAERGVSMVFQSYALYPHMSVYKNIAFGLRLAGKGRADIDAHVRKVATMLQIDALLARLPRELSGGQRQRVAIARAIVREPQVFLLDEPLSNLDAALRAQTRLEIAKLHRDLRATLIYVTHDQTEAMTLADRIVVLNEGRIEQVGPPGELYHRPATRFVAGFLGTPQMNFLDVEIVAGRARFDGGALPVRTGTWEGRATLGIRPEDFHLASAGTPDALGAQVLLVEDLGETRIVHARLPGGGTIALHHREHDTPREGERIEVVADPGRLHLFAAAGWRISAHPEF